MYRNYFSGMLILEFTSASPEKTLEAITSARIPLFWIEQKSELTYQIQVSRKDYRRISNMIQRRGDRLETLRKKGLYWTVKNYFHRPIPVIVFLFLLIFSVYLPSRIFFVTVSGNVTLPDRLIISAAEDCGICFGASRKAVRSEQIKNALLSALPQLQWVGVNTTGCTAVISVRERIAEERPPNSNTVSNLIADRDGYILSATATSGTQLVFPGETVVEGQLLISGYTDCGLCIRASRSEGEFFAQTSRKIRAVVPQTYISSSTAQNKQYKISFLIGKKRINLWKDSRISDTSCGRIYEEYYVSLPGGYQLPIGISIDRYLDYELLETKLSQTDAQSLLQNFSEHYTIQQMVAGQILQKRNQLMSLDDLYQLESSYICREMIGKEQREEIGDINGKRN